VLKQPESHDSNWLLRAKSYLKRSNETPQREEGRGALKEGRLDDAIDAFHRHLRLRPRDAQTWVRLGNALKDTGRYDEAEQAYERGCRLRHNSPEAWRNRGHLAKLRGLESDAATYFRRAFALGGDVEAGRELLKLGHDRETPSFESTIVGCIDGLTAGVIFGWAVDPDHPDAPAEVEILQGETRIGAGQTSLPRPDVAAAGFGATHAGFRIRLEGSYRSDQGPVIARLAQSRRALSNSPYKPLEEDSISQWMERWHNIGSDRMAELRALFDKETDGLLLSIIMPVYDPPVEWLREAIDSVLAQVCTRWELICVDDASTNPEVGRLLAAYAQKDRRVRVVTMPTNGGISRSTNAGLEQANGEFVAFMDHDDAIEPEAVYRLLEATRHGSDLVYSDEIITGQALDEIMEVAARPAFSYDYYISHPYFVHLLAVRRSLARSLGGFDTEMTISMDVDFVLRVIEHSGVIAHIPVPLYRWRTHPGSAGHAKMDAVMAATRAALERHHKRMGRKVNVSNGPVFNTFRHDPVLPEPRTLIIVPTRDRLDLVKPCVDSLLSTTEADILVIDHESEDPETLAYFSGLPERVRVQPFAGRFNFSKMNNEAVEAFGDDYDLLLFANNDLEAIEPGWLEHMSSLCLREDVGAVGGLLLYGDGSIQHGGVVLGVGGPAEHVYKNTAFTFGGTRNPGYLSGLVAVRDYMAVTGACLLIRADVFRRVGGFDELLVVGYNDVDLCLRIREAGFKVLFDGHAVLYHHESATRIKSKQLRHPEDTQLMSSRWADLLSQPDPYFSPFFGDSAPASHVVVKPIDPYAPVRLWTKSVDGSSARPSSRIAPPVNVM
jgi:GT2 family glycosyltransferase/tetratricopeptide (TPR) repeat protein